MPQGDPKTSTWGICIGALTSAMILLTTAYRAAAALTIAEGTFMSNPLDEFSGQSFLDSYSPTNIYGDLKDLDHAQPIRGPFGSMRVTSPMQANIEQVIAIIPGYKSAAAFIRDAITHRLHYYLGQGDLPQELNDVLREHEAMSEGLTYVAKHQKIEAVYEEYQRMIREAESVVTRLEMKVKAAKVGQTQTNPHWAEKFKKLAEGS
jgi:hypothetical protein